MHFVIGPAERETKEKGATSPICWSLCRSGNTVAGGLGMSVPASPPPPPSSGHMLSVLSYLPVHTSPPGQCQGRHDGGVGLRLLKPAACGSGPWFAVRACWTYCEEELHFLGTAVQLPDTRALWRHHGRGDASIRERRADAPVGGTAS